jgi:hypothetical protein
VLIDLSGTDRVTWSTNDVVNNCFTDVRRGRTYVRSAESSTASNRVSTVALGFRPEVIARRQPAGRRLGRPGRSRSPRRL